MDKGTRGCVKAKLHVRLPVHKNSRSRAYTCADGAGQIVRVEAQREHGYIYSQDKYRRSSWLIKIQNNVYQGENCEPGGRVRTRLVGSNWHSSRGVPNARHAGGSIRVIWPLHSRS